MPKQGKIPWQEIRRIGAGAAAILAGQNGMHFGEELLIDRMKDFAAQTEESAVDADSYPSGVRKSYHTLRFRVRPHNLDKDSMVLYDCRQAIATCGAGVQGAANVYFSGTQDQWLNSTTSATPTLTQSAIAYVSMNPNEHMTGSNILTNTNFGGDEKLCFVHEELIIDASNFSNAASEIQLFIFRSTKPTSISPTSAWNTAISDQGMGLAVALAPPAGATISAGTPHYGALNSAFPYQKPKIALIHKLGWKLEHVSKAFLASGAGRSWVLSVHHNHVMSLNEVNDYATTYVPGTMGIMAVVRGTPVVDVTSGSLVTFSSPEVGMIFTSKKQFKSVANNQNRKIQIGFDNVPTGTTAANQHLIVPTGTSGVVQDA